MFVRRSSLPFSRTALFLCLASAPLARGDVAHLEAPISATSPSRPTEPPPAAKVYNGTFSRYLAIPRISSGSSSCSSTLVSKNALLTAAHCFAGAAAKLTMQLLDGTARTLTCTKSPGALRNPPSADGTMSTEAVRNDLAACVLDRPVDGVDTACIGTPPEGTRRATFVGYGRAHKDGSAFYDGRQREGSARILERRNGIVITHTPDLKHGPDAALGAGDSGGFTGTKDRDGKLWIQAVNSASSSEIRHPNGAVDLRDDSTNYSTDLAGPASQLFLKQWSRDQGVALCGLDGSTPVPPGPSPIPPAPPTRTPTPKPPTPTPKPPTPTPKPPTPTPKPPTPTPVPPAPPTLPPPPPTPHPPAPPEDPRQNHRLGFTVRQRPQAADVDAIVMGSVADRVLRLRTGDRIVAMNGEPVTDEKSLRDVAKRFLAGASDTATFDVIRADGRRERVTHTLTAEEKANRQSFTFGIYPKDGAPQVQVHGLIDGADAAKLGVQPGDIVTHVDGEPVSNAAEAAALVRRKVLDKKNGKIRLTLASSPPGIVRELEFRLP